MKTKQRLCGRKWSVTAENGDHFAVERGKEYTTTAWVHDDNTVTVFSNFWVRVPIGVFFDQDSDHDEQEPK